jgi:hypothetical protein
MKRFLDWLTRDSAALRQAQSEIAWLRGENKRLNDLLTQAWETSRVIPRQPEHASPPAPEAEPFKTLGQQQIDFEQQRIAERQQWEREEQARLDRLTATDSKPS